jgi:sterol 3beta-glucosyltransferase
VNITILTYGSRGDVQPFLALALGLQKAGHSVKLAAPHGFEDFVRQYRIQFAPLAGDPSVISQVFNDAGGNVYRMVKGMQEYLFNIAPEVVNGAGKALQGADLLVHSFAFTTGAHSFACQMGIPDVSVQGFPMFAPTRAFPNAATPAIPSGWMSYFSHWFSTQVFWYGGNVGYYRMRRKNPADFPEKLYWPFTPAGGRPLTPLIFAYSPTILPRPDDWTAPNIHITGYFFLDHPDYEPPEALSNFLKRGDPPVCITFGSMINREMQRVTFAVLDALANTGNRAIFLTGWGGWKPENPPEHTLFLDSVPHDWLFARCKAVVHHGGAGTTAAALRSGVPNIVVPHAADQPFWGKRVAAVRAGPQPIPVKKLSAENVAQALTEVETSTICEGAAEVGRLIRTEDGVSNAVALIEAHAAESAGSSSSWPSNHRQPN